MDPLFLILQMVNMYLFLELLGDLLQFIKVDPLW
jgi:hypothetical protein